MTTTNTTTNTTTIDYINLPKNWRPGAGLSAKNEKALAALLDETQKRCRVRVLDPGQVMKEVGRVYKYLQEDLQVTRAAMKDTYVEVSEDVSSDFPTAYHYRPETTIITVGFDENICVSVYRDWVPENGLKIDLSESAKKCMLEKLTTIKHF